MVPVNKAEVGLRIRKLRKTLGLRQWQLARMLGSTQPAVHKYENGAVPEVGRLLRLAEIGNTTVEWILTGRHSDTGSVRRQRLSPEVCRLAERLHRVSVQQKQTLESVLQVLEAAVGSRSPATRGIPMATEDSTPSDRVGFDPETLAELRSAIGRPAEITRSPADAGERKPRQQPDKPFEPPMAARGL